MLHGHYIIECSSNSLNRNFSTMEIFKVNVTSYSQITLVKNLEILHETDK